MCCKLSFFLILFRAGREQVLGSNTALQECTRARPHRGGAGAGCSCMALCVATAHPHLAAATRYLAVCTAARCYRRQNAVVRCCRARVARGSAAPPHSLLHGGGLLPRVSTRRCGAAAELSTRQHGAAAQSWRQHGPAVVLTRQRGPAAIGKGGFPVAPCHTKNLRQCACEDPARAGHVRTYRITLGRSASEFGSSIAFKK